MKPKAKSLYWINPFAKRPVTEKQQRLAFLKKFSFFRQLSNREIEKVSNILYERHYQKGEYVFEINQPGAALFLIQSGEVNIEIPFENGHAGHLATLKAGDFLGELALLDDSPRSASARATAPTLALALFRSDLNHLLKVEPEVTAQIFRSLASVVGERLKATNEILSELQNAQHLAS